MDRPDEEAGLPPTSSPAVGASPLVPGWLANVGALGWRCLVVAALVIVLAYLAGVLRVVTVSIAVAVVIAAVLAPLVLGLRARGHGRTAAAGIVWAGGLLVVAGVLLAIAVALLPDALALLPEARAGLARLQSDTASLDIPPAVSDMAHTIVSAVGDTVGGAVGQIVGLAAAAVTVAILAGFLVFYLLRDGDRAWIWTFQNLGDPQRARITSAGDEALSRVGGYLRGTALLAGLVAISNLAFLVVLGVPHAVPLALAAFLGGFIPYLGGLVVTVITLLVAYAALGPWPTVVLLLAIVVRNAILGSLVRPAVYGRTVSIHPALVLLVLPVGFEVAGIAGLFAVVPATAVVLAVASAAVELVEPHPRPTLPDLVPAWLDRVAQFSWRILVITGLVALAVGVAAFMPLLVVPLVLAVIVTASLDPAVGWLVARGHTRGRAAAIALGGGALLVVLVLVAAALALVGQASDVAGTLERGARSSDSAAGGLLGLPAAAVAQGGREMVSTVVRLAAAIGSVIVVVGLGCLVAFYFLRDGAALADRATGRLPSHAATEVRALGSRAMDVLGGYMVGTAAISFVGAASQWVIMVVLGLPLAAPVFVLSFILGFVPYIGGFLSTGIAFLITVAVGSTADIVVMAVWTVVFNIVAGNVVSPLVYARTVHLHPAVVLMAIPAGSAVAGVMGMFLVVPVLGVVAATWREALALLAARQLAPSELGPERAAEPAAAIEPAT